MFYYWIPVAILLLAAVFSDTNTWSPFQSDQVKEICAHMTRAEHRAAAKRGALWGVLIGVIPATIALVLGIVVFRSALVVVAVLLFHVAFDGSRAEQEMAPQCG